jgi:hypothetical protein
MDADWVFSSEQIRVIRGKKIWKLFHLLFRGYFVIELLIPHSSTGTITKF